MDDDEDDPFLHTRSRLDDPPTSRAAVRGISPLRMTMLRLKVLKHFGRYPYMTDLRLQELCQDHGSTYRTRRSELVDMGLIEDSHTVAVQKGTKRIVWRITPAGRAALQINRDHV